MHKKVNLNFALGIALLALYGVQVTSMAQTTTVTLMGFPGTEKTAVEIQTILADYGVEVVLYRCEEVLSFEMLQAITPEIDFLLVGTFTSEYLQITQKLLGVLSQMGGGAVGVGAMHKIHIVTIPATGIRSLADLDDENHAPRTSTGPEQSVHDAHAHDVFRAEKLYNVLNLHQHNELPSQPDFLLSHVLDAFFETAKVPSPHVAKVADRNKLILVAIPHNTVTRMNALKDEGEAPYIPTEIYLSAYEEEASGSVETAGVTEIVAATGRPSEQLVELVAEVLISKALMDVIDLVKALQWLKDQKIPIHSVAEPIIERFLEEHAWQN
ncbi:MAG: hypothetical protein DRN68_07975 [Thaumarchaeota archaeon]|nr:MAG: hypothetical protein DRN68_07975 [Nitrososphaerota archaeon]